MGHEQESPIWVPNPRRIEQVDEVLKETYKSFLEKGGAITNTGIVVAHPYDEINEDALTLGQYKILQENRFITERASQFRDVIPDWHIYGKTFLHIIKSDTLRHLGYKKNTRGYGSVPYLVIQGKDPQSFRHIDSLSHAMRGFSMYVKKIYQHEGLQPPDFIKKTRATREVLMQLANEYGLGEVKNIEPNEKRAPLVF